MYNGVCRKPLDLNCERHRGFVLLFPLSTCILVSMTFWQLAGELSPLGVPPHSVYIKSNDIVDQTTKNSG